MSMPMKINILRISCCSNLFPVQISFSSFLHSFFFQPEMIRKAGYPAESHVIMTEDGYLLTLHRIPGGNNSLPVLLQHGFLGSSADWIVLGKGKAFGTIVNQFLKSHMYHKIMSSISPLL